MKIFFQEEAINDSVALEYEAFETYLFGINPASIKAIRNKKFQNTLISTREFEARLKTIFASCNNNVLELYVKNLNKNLWEIDEMAANMLGKSHELYSKFKEYASYKQTTIKVTDKKAELLANHYEKSKSKIEEELLRLKKEFLASKKKEQEFSKKKQEEYKALLTKRQEYRMQKFGFELKEVGWYNAARKIKLEEIEKFELNIKISNGNQYDRVYAYVIDQRINSIYSCLAKDKVHFDYVYQEDPYLILLKGQEFKIIGVGYKNEIVGNKLETFKQQKVVEAQLELEDDTQKEFKQTLKHYTRGYKKENKIIVDLEYQAFFYQKQKQKEKEIAEMEFRNQLYDAVFPCDFKEDTAVSEVNLLDQIAGN